MSDTDRGQYKLVPLDDYQKPEPQYKLVPLDDAEERAPTPLPRDGRIIAPLNPIMQPEERSDNPGVPSVGAKPLSPSVARAYEAGPLPPENPGPNPMDTLSAETPFAKSMGLTPERIQQQREESGFNDPIETERVQRLGEMRNKPLEPGMFGIPGTKLWQRVRGLGAGLGRDVESAIEAMGVDPKSDVAQWFRDRASVSDAEANRPVVGETTWEQIKEKPTIGGMARFVLEQGVGSVPDMLMMATPGGMAAYVGAQSGNIGQQRAENNDRGDADGKDILSALPAAVASAAMERLGLHGIFGAPAKSVLGRMAQSFGVEAVTEAMQSTVEYGGGTIGTEKGFDASEAADQALAGAVAGGPMGGAIRGGVEVHDAVRGRRVAPTVITPGDVESPIPTDVIARGRAAQIETIDPLAARAKVDAYTADPENAPRPSPEEAIAAFDVQEARPTNVAPEAAPIAQRRQRAAPAAPSGDFVAQTERVESGGNATAANPKSSARGAHQFIDSTWLDVVRRNRPDLAKDKSDADILALRNNPLISAQIAAAYANENGAALRRNGHRVDNGTLYLSHFLGAGGANAVLSADPNTPVSQVLKPGQIRANRSVLEGKTAGEVTAWAYRKMGADSGQAASVPLPPADSPEASQYEREGTQEFITRILGDDQGRGGDVQLEQAGEDAPESAPAAPAMASGDVAVTSAGREVPVRYKVVEASDLVTSNLDDGRVNPAYPAERQPRDRSRGASQTQIQRIASELDPRRLGRSVNAADGAPIVSPDNIVESGNGRSLAIQRAYANGGTQSARYREYLQSEGFDTTGMTAPVLVRERDGAMSPDDVAGFIREANERDTLSYSAPEQTQADAEGMSDDLLGLYRDGDVDSAENRPFVRSFMQSVIGSNDQGNMMAADGSLSQQAVQRIRGALLYRAFGDERLVSQAFEATDSNIRGLAGALTDVAAMWAKMRSAIADGRVDPSMDITPAITEAVSLIDRARRENRSVADLVGQRDAFSGALDPLTEGVLTLFFNGPRFTKPASRARVAKALRYYVDEAMKAAPGGWLFGEAAQPADILELARKKNPDENELSLEPAQPAAAEPPARAGSGELPSSERDQRPSGASLPAERSEQAEQPVTAAPESGAASNITISEMPSGKSVIVRGLDESDASRARVMRGMPEAGKPLWNAKEHGWVISRKHAEKIRAALSASNGNASLDQASADSVAVEAGAPDNLSQRQPLSGVQVSQQGVANVNHVMVSGVLRSIHDNQILRSVVQGVPVDVMDDLIGQQGATNAVLSNPAMLREALTIPVGSPVPSAVARFVQAVSTAGDSEAGASAVDGAPKREPTGLLVSPERGTAGGARQGNGGQGSSPTNREGTVPPDNLGTSKSGSGLKASANTIFTEAAAESARAKLKEILNRVNSGIDPELFTAGITLAGYHAERGARKFAAFSKAMIDDLGEGIRPYLRSLYEAVRNYPGMESVAAEMSSADEIAAAPTHDESPLSKSDNEKPQASADPLRDAFVRAFEDGRGFDSITEARALAAEILGKKVEPGTAEAKALDEAIEAAVVKTAQGIVANEDSAPAAYQQLVDLYARQPKLSVRTSTSVEQMAYSTPVPLGYVASKLAGITDDSTVFEPSAGNGALMIDANPSKVRANELNEDRAKALRSLYPDATVTTRDATDYAPKRMDVVIANPPFGPVRDEAGETRNFDLGGGYRTNEIDHAIAMKALSAMKDDGRAVLIVGGIAKTATSEKARSDAYNGKSKREFYYRLYSEYNITDHFTVAGELYERQGAGWPVDVIVIEGRGKSAKALPAASVPRVYSSWDALSEVLTNERRNETAQPTRGSDRGDLGDGRESAGVDATDSGRSGDGGPDRRSGIGTNDQPAGIRNGSPDGKPERARVGADEGRPQADPSRGPDRSVGRYRPVETAENARQSTYTPGSGAPAMGTLVPVNMQAAAQDALANLKSRVGSIDTFVADRLGYSQGDLYSSFGGEQVDALALAIDNIERNAGFIIGDQCVAGETLIFDPIAGTHTPIERLARAGESITVLSLTRNGFEPRLASAPFLKGVADLHRVTLDDGSFMIVTEGHRFLSSEGWSCIRSGLKVGDALISTSSRAALSLDSVVSSLPAYAPGYARHSSHESQGCSDHYSSDLRPCDAPPLAEKESDPTFAPSRDGAPSHSHYCSPEDGHAASPECSHRSRSSAPHSKNGSSPWVSHAPLPTSSQGLASSASLSEPTRPELAPSGPYSAAPRPEGGGGELGLLTVTGRKLSVSSVDDTGLRQVVSIAFERRDNFYDMQVPGALNYVANELVNHNTGIGKGRVVAGLIRYAMRQNLPPIFVTEKPNLYKDMYRDLVDIGVPEMLGRDLNITMTNTGDPVPLDEEGNVVLRNPSAKAHAETLARIARDGLKASDVDVMFTTYNQMQSIGGEETARQRALRDIASGGLVILDESHNAGGTGPGMVKPKQKEGGGALAPTRAEFVRELVKVAKGVFYSSATYAKRPDVMDLYAATDMRLAVDDMSKLGEAIAKGGVPMQQIVAAMLARAGQYLRRERSFDGIAYNTPAVEVDERQYEAASGILKAIQSFSEDHVSEAAANINETLKESAENVAFDGSIGGAGASSTNFTAVMHNVIDQMLLAFKAKDAADRAIAAVSRGEKPVITLANTLETMLTQYAEQDGVKIGQQIEMTFADVFRRYLERSRWLSVKKPFMAKGEKAERIRLSDAQLGPAGVRAFNEAMEMIGDAGLESLPGSPIDYMISRMEAAGLKVAEITGRTLGINYRNGKAYLKARGAQDKSIAGRIKAISDFNDGKVDAMVLNRSGATGLSLHASSKFKDKRKRRMIIAQAEGNIDTHMQMLGRVHRTGQVVLPEYDQLVAGIPAEKRPASVLAKKMASLNANTTASRESAVTAKDVPDFMNVYGDEVAARLMAEEPDIHDALGSPLSEEGEGYATDGAMRKVTGRIPLLSLREQEEVYLRLETEYAELLANKEAAGENALEAKTLDLDARTEDTQEGVPPKSNSTSPFAAAVNVEKVNIKRMGKPHRTEVVREMIAEGKESSPDMAAAQRAGETFMADQLAKGPDKTGDSLRTRLAGIMDRWRAVNRAIQVGQGIKIRTDNGNLYGVVTSISRTGNPKNPLALGSWKATIALVDASRQITIPFSQITPAPADANTPGFIVERADKVGDFPILEAFDRMQTDSRENRHIITGNILAGFDFMGAKGQIINFTDDQGEVRQGILAPRGWDFAKHKAAQAINLTDHRAVQEFATMSANGITGKGRNGDIVLQIFPGRGEMIATVARSKKAGGEYFLNRELTAALGSDFVSSSSGMTARARAANFGPVAQVLLKNGVRFAVPGNAKEDVKARATEIMAKYGVQVERAETPNGWGSAEAGPEQRQAAKTQIPGNVDLGKTLQGALSWIGENSGNEFHRELAAVLEPLSEGVALQEKAFENRPSDGATVHARGEARVILNTNADGRTEEVVLHEAIHAAVATRVGVLRRVSTTDLSKPLALDVARLTALRDTASQAMKVAADDLPTITRFRMRLADASLDEFLTYALTDTDFAAWLETVPTKDVYMPVRSRTVWQGLVDMVRKMIRLPAKYQPELVKILSAGSSVAESTNKVGGDIFDSLSRIEPASTKGALEMAEREGAFEFAEADPGAAWEGAQPQAGRINRLRTSIGNLIGDGSAIGERFDKFRVAVQDDMLPLLRTQQKIEALTGEKLGDSMNAYISEEGVENRIGARLEVLQDEHVQPLFDAMKAEGVSEDDLHTYLYARHAPERNARISQINPAFQDGTGSGMTDAEAGSIMERFDVEGKIPALERVAARVDAILDFAVDTRVEGGLLSEDEAEAWRSTYQHYVPLRGQSELNPETGTPDRPRKGSGINVRGPESKRALGRKSRADSILAHALLQATEAVARAETNEVGQAFYRLVKANPDPDFWVPDKVTRKPTFNAKSGQVSYRSASQISAEDAPYTVSLKINGHEHRVTMNRANPEAVALADAVRNLSAVKFAAIVKYAGAFTRAFSAVNTRFNPAFVLKNMIRDIQTAAVISQQYEDMPGLTRGILRDWRKAVTATKDGDGEWSEWRREFELAGGKTYFNDIGDIDRIKRRVNTGLRSQAGWRIAFRTFFDAVELVNNQTENALRLSMYKNARQRGASKEVAATMARNITVNFNRRGKYGPLINAGYAFFNAAVQGNVNLAKAAYKSKKVRLALAGFVVLGFASDMLNAFMSDDDDDGESFWDKVPEYEKQGNLRLMIPGWGDKGPKLPLGLGLNAFVDMGRYISETLRGKRTVGSAGSASSLSFLNAFNPLGSAGSWLNYILPTMFDPVADIETNKDFAGRPIQPEENPFSPPPAPSSNYWPSVNPIARALTDGLNSATGGDEVMPGAASVSPEVLEYLFGYYTGGAGRFVGNVSSIVTDPFKPDRTLADVPFLNTVVGSKPGWLDKSAYYNRIDEIETATSRLKDYEDAENPEGAARFSDRNGPILGLKSTADAAQRQMRTFRKQKLELRTQRDRGDLNAADYREQLGAIETQEKEVVSSFNASYVEAVKLNEAEE